MYQIIEILNGEFAGERADLMINQLPGRPEKFSVISRDRQQEVLILEGVTDTGFGASNIKKKNGKVMEAYAAMYVNGILTGVHLEYKVIVQVWQ